MLIHIVSIQINSNYSKQEKEKAIDDIVLALKKLPEIIKQIKYYEVGVNISESLGGMDIVLISKFNNEKELDIYKNHKEHLKVVELIKKHKEKSFFTDFSNAEFTIKN